MFDDDDEILPPREEEVPERLAKKWEDQEKRAGLIRCPSCQKQILAASSFCAYCGKPMGFSNRLWVMTTAIGLLIVIVFLGAQFFIRH